MGNGNKMPGFGQQGRQQHQSRRSPAQKNAQQKIMPALSAADQSNIAQRTTIEDAHGQQIG